MMLTTKRTTSDRRSIRTQHLRHCGIQFWNGQGCRYCFEGVMAFASSAVRSQEVSELACQQFGDYHRHSVSNLTHRLRPTPSKHIVVRERLKPGALAHREIAD